MMAPRGANEGALLCSETDHIRVRQAVKRNIYWERESQDRPCGQTRHKKSAVACLSMSGSVLGSRATTLERPKAPVGAVRVSAAASMAFSAACVHASSGQ